MRSHSKHLLIWRIDHDFAPLSWFHEGCDSFGEVIVVEDGDVTVVVAYCYMVVLRAVSDASRLLVFWGLTQSGSGRLDLFGFIWLTLVHLLSPNFTLLNQFFIFDAEFEDFVIVTAGQESTFFFDDLETPRFTVVMSNTVEHSVGAVKVDSLDGAIIVANENLAVQDVECRGGVKLLEVDLSDELIFTLLGSEN